MCGRYSFFNEEELYDRFKVIRGDWELRDHYNVAPSQNMPVIINDGSQNLIQIMRWGLLPTWAKDEKTGYKMINAREETLASKPIFKNLLPHNRCLIPASGFFEWQRSLGPKVPYFIHLKNESLFAFAGLYSEWKNPATANIISSYTIITTAAIKPISNIHERMPYIIARSTEDDWLNADESEPETALRKIELVAPEKIAMYPVSPLVNKPSNDTPAILGPVPAHS